MGFIDYGGASFCHTMGGLAGFMGTYLIGPREGLFKWNDKLSFIIDDNFLDESEDEDSDGVRPNDDDNMTR